MNDLTGQKFGRLIVIQRVPDNKHGQPMWLCECDCGIKKIIRGGSLKSGNTKSCGCLQKEKTAKRFTTHGHYKSKTYESWDSMIQRCTNPKNEFYYNYGGRGIKVCKCWLKFENFLEDMGEVPEGCQIDRIDNNKGYDKSNCWWVTRKQQQRNKRNNHLETHGGKTQCLSLWAEETGIPASILWKRFNRGWSSKRALTTPVQKKGRK